MDIFETLSADAKLVERSMQQVIPRNKKPSEVYSLIWDLLDRGGKRFRPPLCMLSCQIVGGKKTAALPAATAIELFHNFTLIHDDIEDDSLLRRGKPTLHILYGTPLAINAGDGLFMMVWRSMLSSKLPPAKNLISLRMLLSAFTNVLEGQAKELNWYCAQSWKLSEKDYFDMVDGKTAALIEGACGVGAFIGGGSQQQIKTLSSFGSDIGIAFQIQDDILNIAGDEKKYGKEIGGDITEGKRTLMTIHYLAHASKKDRFAMIKILNSKTKKKSVILHTIRLLKASGSVNYAKMIARRYALRAKAALRGVPQKNATKKLINLADFLINRDY